MINKKERLDISKKLSSLYYLRNHPKHNKFTFIESKFLNTFGKVIGEMLNYWDMFYTYKDKHKALKKIAILANVLEGLIKE